MTGAHRRAENGAALRGAPEERDGRDGRAPRVASGRRRRRGARRVDGAMTLRNDVGVLLRRGAMSADAPAWDAVSADHPCPCCGATAGCGVATGAGFVHCRTAASVWPMVGGGWLHVYRLGEP